MFSINNTRKDFYGLNRIAYNAFVFRKKVSVELTFMSVTSKSRVVGLDIIRSVAVLLVMFCHSPIAFSTSFAASKMAFIIRYSHVVSAVYGVELFFVLSGFLIGGILLRQYQREGFSRASLLPFWIRRWFRTLPNYFLYLLVLDVYALHHGEKVLFLRHLFFCQNLFSYHVSDSYGFSWSLCVEEWMYLLLPLILLLWHRLLRGKQQAVVLLTLATLAFFPMLARILTSGTVAFDAEVRKVVIYRLDSINIGIFLAYLKLYQPRWFEKLLSRNFLILGVVSSFLLMIFLGPIVQNVDYVYTSMPINAFLLPFVDLSLALIIAFFSSINNIKKRADSFWMTISTLSYSLYLFHIVAFILVSQATKTIKSVIFSNLVVIPVCFAAAFSIAALIYRFYEKPLTDLRERWNKKSSSAVLTPK